MDISVTNKSRLLRLATWILIICAISAPIWLVIEWYHFTQAMPDHGWNFRVMRILALILANLIFAVMIAVLFVLFLWVRMARALPDLKGWHLEHPESEFKASDETEEYDFADYLAQEEKTFQELETMIRGAWSEHSQGDFNRYQLKSVCNPDTIVDRNWNRSHVLKADNPIGGVLLVHGLSDSPYSLRKLGLRLHAEGYTVVWIRVPGHGTCPGALANVNWQDWSAAVRIAVKGLRKMLPDRVPLVLAGYSNGGALSVQYALSAANDPDLPRVDAILLFSPMIGISPLAQITRLYYTVAIVSQTRKAQWSGIEAEVDPFKFSSWPMNASVQAWAMTREVEEQLALLDKSGRMNELPPILAMQSVVDSTVTAAKLITELFDRLESKSSELFLFDIDRVTSLNNLFNLSFEKKIFPKLDRTDLPYRLSILKNTHPDSRKVMIQTRDGQMWREQPTEMAWPPSVVSLSHLAVPIPLEDPIYGSFEFTKATGLPLGSLTIRAEPSALLMSDSLFVRCRSNPFYHFMEDRLVDWLREVIEAPAGEPVPSADPDRDN